MYLQVTNIYTPILTNTARKKDVIKPSKTVSDEHCMTVGDHLFGPRRVSAVQPLLAAVLLAKELLPLGPGYTRDCLPAYSFVLRARTMVLTGQRTLSNTSRARQ